jgi:hypothetical protein
MALLDSLEAVVEPALDAIAPVIDAAPPIVDEATARAREVGQAIRDGLGDALGLTEDALAQLGTDVQDGLIALASAARQLRVELAALRALMPRLDGIVRLPLAGKLQPDSRAAVLEVVARAARLSRAVVSVFGAIKPLVRANPTLAAQLRARFGAWYDAG